MLRELGSHFSNHLRRWIPDPFVFALALTLIVAIMALSITNNSINQVFDHWYRGFWILLEFSMQMVLILVTGFAIALSPSVAKLIDKLALLAKTPTSVYVLVMILGGLFCLISWGWVVLTAVFARELAKRVKGVDYAYLVACVYLSSQPWVSGLSSSIPLLLNTEGNFLIKTGVLEQLIPISETLGSKLNWLFMAVYFLSMPFLIWLLRPKDDAVRDMAKLTEQDHQQANSISEEALSHSLANASFSDRINNAAWLPLSIGLACLWFVARHFAERGFDLNLNIMIFLFFGLGLICHQSSMRYVIAMKRSCGNISGIVFQYPFYAGIMGITMYSGLGAEISNWLAEGATLQSLPLIAQLAGGLINFAIPSAGGEWAVIGPALTETAIKLGESLPADQLQAYIARIAMAVAYGETSTNLLQPFFLLVILPVMGAGVRIQARDVMGYLVIPFIYITVTTALLLAYTPL